MSSSLFAECAGKASGRAGSLFRLATLDLERQHSTRLSSTSISSSKFFTPPIDNLEFRFREDSRSRTPKLTQKYQKLIDICAFHTCSETYSLGSSSPSCARSGIICLKTISTLSRFLVRKPRHKRSQTNVSANLPLRKIRILHQMRAMLLARSRKHVSSGRISTLLPLKRRNNTVVESAT